MGPLEKGRPLLSRFRANIMTSVVIIPLGEGPEDRPLCPRNSRIAPRLFARAGLGEAPGTPPLLAARQFLGRSEAGEILLSDSRSGRLVRWKHFAPPTLRRTSGTG